ncbi:lactate oxidase, partial [Enterococcus faecium]
MSYEAGSAGGVVVVIGMVDLEIGASQVLPAGGVGSISSGAGALCTTQENERPCTHRLIMPHVLREVEIPDTT